MSNLFHPRINHCLNNINYNKNDNYEGPRCSHSLFSTTHRPSIQCATNLDNSSNKPDSVVFQKTQKHKILPKIDGSGNVTTVRVITWHNNFTYTRSEALTSMLVRIQVC